MQKTGERYAAARRHVPATTPLAQPAAPALPATPLLLPRVADPGLSDDAVRNATGRGWDDWFRILDDWNGTQQPHPTIARHVREVHGVPGWWAQTVTVGYERARGLRAVHQTSRGFEVSVSKTLDAPVALVRAAFADARQRDRFLEPGLLRSRSTTPRQQRFELVADGTTVMVVVDAKGSDRSVATVVHSGLSGPEAIERERAAWRGRLSALAASLQPSPVASRVASGRRQAS
jgi:hypothetical protein